VYVISAAAVFLFVAVIQEEMSCRYLVFYYFVAVFFLSFSSIQLSCAQLLYILCWLASSQFIIKSGFGNIMNSMSVCLSVCLYACRNHKLHGWTSCIFCTFCIWPWSNDNNKQL